ncbi:hypothetical protein B4168_1125 [Anoxybacillus flavithermus]|nr:hypothetical protein B4168_1125 [Anoxybacillus flavithermus]
MIRPFVLLDVFAVYPCKSPPYIKYCHSSNDKSKQKGANVTCKKETEAAISSTNDRKKRMRKSDPSAKTGKLSAIT